MTEVETLIPWDLWLKARGAVRRLGREPEDLIIESLGFLPKDTLAELLEPQL